MHAIRTGAWTARAALEVATASGEDVGRTLPMAFNNGRPSMTPAPRKNVRRGILQLFCIISDVLFGVKTVLERKAGGDHLDEHGSSIIDGLKRLHGMVDHAFVKSV